MQEQKNRVEVQGNNLHFPLFWTIQNANDSPEPRLCSFVLHNSKLAYCRGWRRGEGYWNTLSLEGTVPKVRQITAMNYTRNHHANLIQKNCAENWVCLAELSKLSVHKGNVALMTFYFFQGCFDKLQGLLAKIQGLFKDLNKFFNF